MAVSPADRRVPRGLPGRRGIAGAGGGRICSSSVPSIRGPMHMAPRLGSPSGRAARDGLVINALVAMAFWPVSSRSMSRRVHAVRVSSPRALSRRARVVARHCGAVLQGRSRGLLSYRTVVLPGAVVQRQAPWRGGRSRTGRQSSPGGWRGSPALPFRVQEAGPWRRRGCRSSCGSYPRSSHDNGHNEGMTRLPVVPVAVFKAAACGCRRRSSRGRRGARADQGTGGGRPAP